MDNNDFWHNSEAVNQGSISGVAGVLLPIDSIDQFNQQAAGGADYGRNPGSMVNVVLKSGTNAFHGTAYYFNRNEALAAANPFTPADQPNPKLRNQNYGFSLGGPIVRNRLFFFLTYEKQKFTAGNALQATVPSDAWVTQAEQVLAQYGVPVNPVMTNVYNTLWPARIHSAPASQPNYFSSDNNDYKSDNGVVKIDYQINSKNSVFARAFLGYGYATAFAGSVYKEYFQVVPSHQPNFAVVWNGVLTPRLVNQLLLGVNYFNQTFDDVSHGFNLPALGFNTNVTNPANFGAPNIELAGFANGGVGETPQLGRIDTTGHLTDNLAYNRGAHALKFGGEVRESRLDVFYQRDVRGGFYWSGDEGPWANDASIAAPAKSLASFLAGYLGADRGNIATGDPQRVYIVNSYEWWAQDNWQVSPRLDISYGVRYTYNGRIHEDGHKGISTFIPGLANATYPGFGFAGGNVDGLYPADYNNFGPRLGFAFTPKRGGKTVIRGGYGVYYDIVNGNLFIDNRAGSSAGRGISRNPAGPTPVYTVTAGPETIQAGVPIFGGSVPSPPFGAYAVNQNLRSPYVQQFNINVQHQLTRSTLFQIAYVGNQARKLIINRNINQPIPGTAATIQEERPYNALYPNLKGITEISSAGNSHYNALQMSIRTTGWHGLSGQFAYTYSNAKDVMSNVRNNLPTDSYNLQFDYGNADFDTRHSGSAYLVYDVPQLAQSARWLTRGWQLNALAGFDSGFPFTVYASDDFSGTRNFKDRADQVGDPFSGVSQPPTPGGRYVNGYRWFNGTTPGCSNCFVDPAPGSFGTTRRNQFYGPGFGAIDFSVFKNTPITERVSTQFRVEIFNITNRLNLANPDTGVGSGSGIGLIYGTRHGGDSPGIGYGEPRNIQLALKIVF